MNYFIWIEGNLNLEKSVSFLFCEFFFRKLVVHKCEKGYGRYDPLQEEQNLI